MEDELSSHEEIKEPGQAAAHDTAKRGGVCLGCWTGARPVSARGKVWVETAVPEPVEFAGWVGPWKHLVQIWLVRVSAGNT